MHARSPFTGETLRATSEHVQVGVDLNQPILIEKYTSAWVNQFNAIKSQLETVLSGLECSIEHVGSTAVPYLDSKPIIDIDIVYQTKPDFEKIKPSLEKIGYHHNGNQLFSKL